jgi:antitoxin Phd
MKIDSTARDEKRILEELPSISASSLKNHIGEALLQATETALAITRHNRTEFVLVPVTQYLELQRAKRAPLEAMSAQFDAMVIQMNAPAAKNAVAGLFSASPADLGSASVNNALSHGH